MVSRTASVYVRRPDPRELLTARPPVGGLALAVGMSPDVRTVALNQLDRLMNWVVGGLLLASVAALVFFQAH